MKLISIPEDKYDEYRLDLIFNCYKFISLINIFGKEIFFNTRVNTNY